MHFNDLLVDLDGEMRRVAAFLSVSVDEDAWPQLVEEATFRAMKDVAQRLDTEGGGGASTVWRNGTSTFFHKRTIGRWHDVLTDADLALYEGAAGRLDPSLRIWLEQGRHGHDPNTGI